MISNNSRIGERKEEELEEGAAKQSGEDRGGKVDQAHAGPNRVGWEEVIMRERGRLGGVGSLNDKPTECGEGGGHFFSEPPNTLHVGGEGGWYVWDLRRVR